MSAAARDQLSLAAILDALGTRTDVPGRPSDPALALRRLAALLGPLELGDEGVRGE